MLKYILKRILIFIPTVLVISLITFGISVNAPGDPVEQMLGANTGQGQSASFLAGEKAYLEVREKLGLDLPVFYFSLSNISMPDTLHRVAKRLHRETLDRMIYEYGNWGEIDKYYKSIRDVEFAVVGVPKDSLNATGLIKIKDAINVIYASSEERKINSQLFEIEKYLNDAPSLLVLKPLVNNLRGRFNEVKQSATTWKRFVPSLNWYGAECQYHRWFFGDKPWFSDGNGRWKSAGFIRGDFGISYQDQRPVGSVIWDAVKITMMISLMSIFLTYLIAIPIGVYSARNKGSFGDQSITTVLFVLYSLPSFWLATLAIVFLCGGDFLDIFPPYGLGGDLGANATWFDNLMDRAYHLILPLILWTYGSFTYLSRQMRGGMLAVLGQDYIRTARAKGLPEDKVVWKHAMRNSLLPVITLFASVFPLMISGAIVLEIIFSIPGMGKAAFEAIVARNYPIVFAVMMFSCVLTLIGYLVSDILYAVVDPRISYSGGKK